MFTFFLISVTQMKSQKLDSRSLSLRTLRVLLHPLIPPRYLLHLLNRSHSNDKNIDVTQTHGVGLLQEWESCMQNWVLWSWYCIYILYIHRVSPIERPEIWDCYKRDEYIENFKWWFSLCVRKLTRILNTPHKYFYSMIVAKFMWTHTVDIKNDVRIFR